MFQQYEKLGSILDTDVGLMIVLLLNFLAAAIRQPLTLQLIDNKLFSTHVIS